MRDYEQGGPLWRRLRYGGHGARRRLERRSIHERGQHINNRREYGHWDMDLIEGRGRRRYLLVLVERKSRFVCAGLLGEKRAGAVAQVAKRILRGLKVKSITTDIRQEFSQEQLIEAALDCRLYFTDPYKSWQKRLVENTNGSLRQYCPKGHTLCGVNMARKVARAVKRLNRRARKCLGGHEPAELLHHFVVS